MPVVDPDLAIKLWGVGAVVALMGAAYLAGRLIVLAVGARPEVQASPPRSATRREITFGFVDCPRTGYAVTAMERCRYCPSLRSMDRGSRPRHVVCEFTPNARIS